MIGRDVIIKTQLFKMLLKMPKGALLHAHLDATVDTRWLLQTALQYPTMHVKASAPINAATINSVLPEFHALPKENHQSVGLTHASYVPDTWVPLAAARSMFDSSLGGPEGFDRWVIGALTINPTEAYQTHNTGYKVEDPVFIVTYT
jgi:adenosine deaminase CECR1